VDEVQHHRSLAEEVGEANRLPVLVGEGRVERELGAELLVEADLGEHRGADPGAAPRLLLAGGAELRVLPARRAGSEREDDGAADDDAAREAPDDLEAPHRTAPGCGMGAGVTGACGGVAAGGAGHTGS